MMMVNKGNGDEDRYEGECDENYDEYAQAAAKAGGWV